MASENDKVYYSEMSDNPNIIIEDGAEDASVKDIINESIDKENKLDKMDDVASIEENNCGIWSKLVKMELKSRKFRSSVGFVVGTMTMATFTDIYLYSTVVPVIPFVFTERMGIGEADIQHWTTVALVVYSAGLIVGSLFFGFLTDKMHSRKNPMLLGLLILLASTLMLCFSRSVALFIAGRVIQGISSGLVWTVGLAIVSDVSPPEKLAFLISFPAISISLAVVLGPVIGGVVYDRAGYYAVFYVCFSILALDIFLRLIMIETPRPIEPDVIVESVDEPKSLLDRLPGCFRLLLSIRFLVSLSQAMVMAWITTALDATLTLHLEEVFGFNSLQAGLTFLAVGGPAIFDPIIGFFCDRYGPRFLVAFGFVILCPVLILLRIPVKNDSGSIAVFMVLLVIVGLGLAFVTTPVMAELGFVVTKVERKNPGKMGRGKGFGQAYAFFNVAFAIGSILGPVEAGEVRTKYGWARETLSLGIITGLMVIPTLLFTGGNMFASIEKGRHPFFYETNHNIPVSNTSLNKDLNKEESIEDDGDGILVKKVPSLIHGDSEKTLDSEIDIKRHDNHADGSENNPDTQSATTESRTSL